MQSAHDLLTRWPALEVAARRARQGSLHLSPGPIADALSGSAEKANPCTIDLGAVASLWNQHSRFRSRRDNPFAERRLAALRNQFGGHAVRTS